jgi:hypothetical protein
LLSLTGVLLQSAVGPLIPAMPGETLTGLPLVAAAGVALCGLLLGLGGAHLSVTRFLRSAP